MADTIDPATAIGTVRLTVSDLDRSVSFYERTLGLVAGAAEASTVVLTAPDGAPLVELDGNPAAQPLDRRATGLFHMAILVPSRLELARSLRRLAVHRWPLDGASDHLVSEALYLSDPDGNGIEIYRDRPRDQWPKSNGQLQMATLPLDLDHLLGELTASPAPDTVPAGTRMGHVHLQVSDLDEAEEFYRGVLGLEVTVRGYPGALFVSAGGYHHHIGLNTWRSAGANAAVHRVDRPSRFRVGARRRARARGGPRTRPGSGPRGRCESPKERASVTHRATRSCCAPVDVPPSLR